MASDQLLHYKLLGKLGSGGMGVVYRAHDTKLGRDVALKFLPEALTTDPAARGRLLAEAQAAARLDHPNVGTVYALEETPAGHLFIVMAHYEGKTLERRLIPLPVGEALGIGLQLAHGLAHAHAAGVVHRDVKPANVMLTPPGLVKLLDFGLARLKEPGGLVAAGLTLGTMEYASPEQVRGGPSDGRTDLWSLGVLLYELLTGVSPFRGGGDAASVMLSVLSREPEPASRANPDVPAAADAVLARLLAKDVRARYGAALEVADALALLARGGAADGPPGVAALARAGPTLAPSRPAAPVPHRLPRPPTPLVGRHDELALLALYLQDPACQVVTLLGLGGVGKTRLAVAAARAQLEGPGFGGVYFVALEAVGAAESIAPSIAEALSLDLRGAEPLEGITRHIGDRAVLLVLDNFEHLTGGAPVVAELVRGCQRLKLLVTSRARLDLLEEWTLPVQGLPYPRGEAGEDVGTFGAPALFLQRARRVRPDFELTPDNRADVAAICALVRGLPLGLELAAAWVRLMTCADIAREVARNLDFLGAPTRHLPERHRSLRAVFDGSWGLLTGAEQAAWRKLAVFHGGFTGEAARRVADVSLAGLAALADRSLLDAAGGRFEQHALLLGYAREKLAAFPGEQRRVGDAHAAHYLGFLAGQREAVRGPGQRAALAAIGDDLGNIRAAWRWALARGRLGRLKGAAEPLRVFYDRRGRIQEGLDLFAETTETVAENRYPVVSGYLLANQAWLCLLMSRFAEAVRLAERSLGLLRPFGETPGLVLGLNTLGAANGSLGHYAAAKGSFVAALTLARAEDDPQTVAILDNLASVEQSSGDYRAARHYYEESLALSRRLGDHSQTVHSLNNLGNLLVHSGQPEAARPLLDEGLRLAQEHGATRMVSFFLANLGSLALHSGDPDRAERAYREALGRVQGGEGDETWLEVWLTTELGRAEAALGRYDAAKQHLAESLAAAQALEDAPLMLHVLTSAAEVDFRQARYERAAGLLSVVLTDAATEREDLELAERLLTSCRGHLVPGDLARARTWGTARGRREVVPEVAAALSE